MGDHLIDGEFQSGKYPTCPRGKVPLSTKDPTAQDLLWTYAQRRRSVDAEFSSDLEEALKAKGYQPTEHSGERLTEADLAKVERALGNTVDLLGTDISAGGVRRLVAELRASWKERDEAHVLLGKRMLDHERLDKLETERAAIWVNLVRQNVVDDNSTALDGIGKLIEQRDQVAAERDSAVKERDRLQSERGGMAYIRLEAEHKALREERDALAQKLEERASAWSEMGRTRSWPKSLLDEVIAERDELRECNENQVKTLNEAVQKLSAALVERNSARSERDEWKRRFATVESDERGEWRDLVKRREAERDAVKAELSQVIAEIECHERHLGLDAHGREPYRRLDRVIDTLLGQIGALKTVVGMAPKKAVRVPADPIRLSRVGVTTGAHIITAIESELNAVRARLERLEARSG
jgi:hypothetical protein